MYGIVLAGGSSSRFGEDKLLYEINGTPMILHVIDRLRKSKSIDEVYVIASRNNIDTLRRLGIDNVVEDDLLIGPIGGVLIALRDFGNVFVVACDMPLLNPELVEYITCIYSKYRDKYLAYIPAWLNGYLEPLHGIYVKSITYFIEVSIKQGNYSLCNMIRSLGERIYRIILDYLPFSYRVSVFNVNTKEDLRKVKDLLHKYS